MPAARCCASTIVVGRRALLDAHEVDAAVKAPDDRDSQASSGSILVP